MNKNYTLAFKEILLMASLKKYILIQTPVSPSVLDPLPPSLASNYSRPDKIFKRKAVSLFAILFIFFISKERNLYFSPNSQN